MTPVTVDLITQRLRCIRPACSCQRRRGHVHCPVTSHGQGRGDRSPSLSVTQRDGRVLIHCHVGCSQRDLIEALQSLGLWPTKRDAPASRVTVRRRSPLNEARVAVLAEARRQARRLAPHREMFADAEALRTLFGVVTYARAVVTAIGADDPRAWDLACVAADLERDALNWELTLE